MRNSRRFRPSPALVVASIALFVAIGGIGWAAATIGTSDIKQGAATKQKLHKKVVSTKKIAADAVTGNKIQDGAVAREKTERRSADSLGGRPVQRDHCRPVGWHLRLWPAGTARMRSTLARMSRAGRDGHRDQRQGDRQRDSLHRLARASARIARRLLPTTIRHVFVNTALAAAAPAIRTNLPFYVAALPE